MVRRFTSQRVPSEKNYVATNAAGQTSGAAVNIIIAQSDNGIADNSMGVPAVVKAIYVMSSMSLDAISAEGGTAAVALVKDIAGSMFSALNPNAALSNTTQQQCIYWYRMSPGRATDSPTRHIGWIKIPKRHQIFNEGDNLRWVMSITSITGGIDWGHCSNFVYKHR